MIAWFGVALAFFVAARASITGLLDDRAPRRRWAPSDRRSGSSGTNLTPPVGRGYADGVLRQGAVGRVPAGPRSDSAAASAPSPDSLPMALLGPGARRGRGLRRPLCHRLVHFWAADRRGALQPGGRVGSNRFARDRPAALAADGRPGALRRLSSTAPMDWKNFKAPFKALVIVAVCRSASGR